MAFRIKIRIKTFKKSIVPGFWVEHSTNWAIPTLHVHNIRACFSHRGEMGTDKSAQVVTRKHRKAVLHPVVWGVEPLASEFTAQRVSQPDTSYSCLLSALILLLLVKLAFCWFRLCVYSLAQYWAVCCAHRLLLPEKSAASLLKSGE